MKKQRAFLKWAGGKYSLIEKITEHLPAGDTLIEPFVGAGSVFLNTDYKKYILGDVNCDLISMFNFIKTSPIKFIEDAKLLFVPSNNHVDRFYEMRTLFNESDDPYQRALLFLYLNRHGYNGLCRYNSLGKFNVPYGRYTRIYFPEKEILAFAKKAQSATFICAPYHETMSMAKKGTVIYCDPPYTPISLSSNFTSYYSQAFNDEEHLRLVQKAYELSKQNIPVLISNHITDLNKDWYETADTVSFFQSKRMINRTVETNRKQAEELLALYKKS